MGTAPEERSISVRRTARWFQAGGEPGEVEETWYVLHGYGELARDVAARVAVVAGPARRVVVPEGLSRFYLSGSSGDVGASWMTREAREVEIEDYVAYLDAVHAAVNDELGGAGRVTLVGFSQGAATASRWIAYGELSAARLVLWGGALPPDVDVEDDRDDFLGLEYVVGERDAYVTAEHLDAERARVEGAGLAWRCRTFPGGHRLDEDVLRALAAE